MRVLLVVKIAHLSEELKMNQDERLYLEELSKGKDSDTNKLDHYQRAIQKG